MHSRELKIWPKYLCLEVLNWGILLEEGSAALLSQIRLTRRRDFSHSSSSPWLFQSFAWDSVWGSFECCMKHFNSQLQVGAIPRL